MSEAVEVYGLEELKRRLENAGTVYVAQAFYKALDRGAGIIAAAVEARAEELNESGSGTRLAESVIVNVDIDLPAKGGTAAVGFSGRDERTNKPMDFIAYWVEYGHRMKDHNKRDITTDGKLTHVPAVPFMRQAFEESGDRAIETIMNILLEELPLVFPES